MSIETPAVSATAVRERTYTWADPEATAESVGRLDGLELLRRITAGELPAPPILATLAIKAVEVELGRIVFTMEPAEWHYNPLLTVHGGALSTILDTAAACAVHTRLRAGTGYTSVDLTVKFLRPATVRSGTLRCEGTVLAMGRRTALAQAQLTDTAGRLVAHATSTCLLVPLDET